MSASSTGGCIQSRQPYPPKQTAACLPDGCAEHYDNCSTIKKNGSRECKDWLAAIPFMPVQSTSFPAFAIVIARVSPSAPGKKIPAVRLQKPTAFSINRLPTPPGRRFLHCAASSLVFFVSGVVALDYFATLRPSLRGFRQFFACPSLSD